MLNPGSADVYTDFSGLSRLRNQAKQETPGAINEVAKQFESLFLNMVLKSMREAKLADSMLDNDQSKFYREMYDQQLAIHLSGKPGVGLADLIVKQLGGEKTGETERMTLDDYLNNPLQRFPPANKAKKDASDSMPISSEVKSRLIKESDRPIQSLESKPIDREGIKSQEPIRTTRQFVKRLHGYAEKAAAELGVEPKVLLAQAALETGWGRSVIKHKDGSSSFNLFNIKAGSSWTGKRTNVATLEYEKGIPQKQMAGFRSYDSYQESFDDYVRLVKNSSRYSQALKHANNPGRYMQELQKAGYATDPHYADKVMRIYHSDDVASYQPNVVVAMQ
ncbi:flagellar assembly peptidoglycan hydrolase FlgJ [Methylotuvimicrobium sp. KM1]|uniref:flagellar assembly peptidoglycan hydrolase FlgJ n=1 Tax=Methylotuvimicrobium sp. KM1 TaxID=3377707 RepID=UPI00384EFBEC